MIDWHRIGSIAFECAKFATPFLTFALGYFTKNSADRWKREDEIADRIYMAANAYLTWLQEVAAPSQMFGHPPNRSAISEGKKVLRELCQGLSDIQDVRRHRAVYEAGLSFADIVAYGEGLQRELAEPFDWRVGQEQGTAPVSTVGVLPSVSDVLPRLTDLCRQMRRRGSGF